MFGLFNRKPKVRQAEGGYTRRMLDADYNAASGNETKLATIHSALVACANLVERSILGSTVSGSPAVNSVIASRIARELMLCGEAVRLIDVRDGTINLLEVSNWVIQSEAGAVSPRDWSYKLTIPAPGGAITRNVTNDAVIHVRIHVDPAFPWRGRNPLSACPAFSEASRRLESYLSVELKTPVGKLIPIPAAASDYETAEGEIVSPLKQIKEGLSKLDGGIATPETMMNSGDGRGSAPARDWIPQNLGPVFPALTPEILESIRSSVFSLAGVPYSLFNAGAASSREAFRAFLVSCLRPLTAVIKAELDTKLETNISFDLGALLSGDVTSRARALKGMVDAGVKLEDALKMVGFDSDQ